MPISLSEPLFGGVAGNRTQVIRVLQTRAFAILPLRQSELIRVEFFVLHRKRDNLLMTTRKPDHIWYAMLGHRSPTTSITRRIDERLPLRTLQNWYSVCESNTAQMPCKSFMLTQSPEHCIWRANQDSNLRLNLRRVVLYPT